MEIKIGDTIKYDSDKSNYSWFGVVVSIAEKSVKVRSEVDAFERVKKNKIVKVY